MISKRSAIGIALAAMLSGCATATPYRSAAPGNPAAGGFSESRLAPDRYRVTFVGNSVTSRKRVERYLLYHVAELTVQNGYDWFEAADQRTKAKSQTVVDPDPFMRPGFMWGGDNGFSRPSWRQSSPRWGGGWRGWIPFGANPTSATEHRFGPSTGSK
jgi:hypothetical protein